MSNYKFPFDRKDWYEALTYEEMTWVWYMNTLKETTEKKAWLSLNTFYNKGWPSPRVPFLVFWLPSSSESPPLPPIKNAPSLIES